MTNGFAVSWCIHPASIKGPPSVSTAPSTCTDQANLSLLGGGSHCSMMTCAPGHRMAVQAHAAPIISGRSDKARISASGIPGILSETWQERLHQITRKPKAFAQCASQPLDET